MLGEFLVNRAANGEHFFAKAEDALAYVFEFSHDPVISLVSWK